ncbi:sigma-54 interaction domain-containing protein [Thalassotalea piscium]
MNVSVIQSMINAIDKPAIFISPDYIIQAANQAYQDIYSTKVKMGKNRCYEVSHRHNKPCDESGETCPLKSCIKTGRAASVVHIHELPDGQEFCDILMRPVKDEDGITLGFLEILEVINFASVHPKKNKMLGKTPPFLAMLKQVNRAAKSEIAVLLQGQTGTGKELAAKALHDGSVRRNKPFVIIECTGLTESLFESELFGHEKGAFTGASHSKKGLIELAEGGTVFFDEIGDVPLNMQVKLLRLLETGAYRSVGSLKQKSANFRFLSASHKDLLSLVKRGEFREDLYYRIAGFPIYLPSLKERQEDIALLACYFLTQSPLNSKHFSDAALALLSRYDFPGNIRELKNIVEQAALLADEEEIMANDLPLTIQQQNNVDVDSPFPKTLSQVECDYLTALVKSKSYTLAELAQYLEMSTRTLYRKIEKHNIVFEE